MVCPSGNVFVGCGSHDLVCVLERSLRLQTAYRTGSSFLGVHADQLGGCTVVQIGDDGF